MKHNLRVTLVILAMFVITQFIGIYVVNHYFSNGLPFGLQTPEIKQVGEFNQVFFFMVVAFVMAVLLLFFLSRLNVEFIIKLWFFLVVLVALGISANVFLSGFVDSGITLFSITFPASWLLALIVVLPLAFLKIFGKNLLVHNATELFVYPGIAAVFVPLLNIYTISFFLVLISIYDFWAVWHSGIMQKMAQYQIKKLNIFSGFFVPHISKNIRMKLEKMKPSERKKKKIRVNIAVLGGGDIVFPIIAAGVALKTAALGLPGSLFIILGATLGLGYLMFFSEKKKFYPAMPFITAGIFLGMLISWALM